MLLAGIYFNALSPPTLPTQGGLGTEKSMDIQIRDKRNGGWFWVERTVFTNSKLSLPDKAVYCVLASFANNEDQSSFPSYESISTISGVSKRQVVYSIRNLESLKYLYVKRGNGRGNPNVYSLLDTKGALYAPFIKRERVQDKQLKGANSTRERVHHSTSNKTHITILNNNRVSLDKLKKELIEKKVLH